ncbi:MAG: hypothetical protein WC676_07835 [Candidatus Omnitrophota bacterium]
MTENAPINEKEILDGKIYAVLSYISILCISPIIFKRENAFALSHGKQGLIIFVGQVAVLILSIVFPWVLRPAMFLLFSLAFWGIIEALRGHYVRLPLVSDIADKITL